MNTLKQAWGTRRDPLFTDRRYDIACLLTWFFYAAWGLLSAFSDVTAFRNISEAYPQLWGAGVGFSALLASAAATTMFFLEPGSFRARIGAKRLEVSSLCAMLGLLVVYPIVLLFMGGADGRPRYDILALSFSYFPFAVFRVMHLLGRIRQLYKYTNGGA